ncbi:hypothetical protein [Allorhizocola rhizosphaerae]|uniref:hypothetical protein n=1 Tax=Allorhizocola rhizosphaerae TaxID=1872709 RepID=UPI0013C34238|nr:hypothetical protein [Allorhizocola rhizosphaerae]
MTSDPGGLVATTVASIEQMPALERALSAAAFIAAVQGEDRRIARIRWAAIAELHSEGMAMAEIAERIGVTPGAVDLALQSHHRGAASRS